MKYLKLFRERTLALALSMCLAFFIPAAYAVVKNVSIVDGDGNALANTKVTINFPNGDTVEEETDDDGALIYDFPGDGDYTIDYPGGSMEVTVSGGASAWVWVAAGVGTAAVAVGMWALLDDSDDSSSSSSPSSPDSPSEGFGNCGATYDINMSNSMVTQNPGDHPTDGFYGTWEIVCESGSASPHAHIEQISSGANPEWECTFNSTGSCGASGICLIGGNATECNMLSTFSGDTWSGLMEGGSDGTLPGGQSWILDFNTTAN